MKDDELRALSDEMEEIRPVIFVPDEVKGIEPSSVELVLKVGIWDFKINWLVYPPAFKDEAAIREYCKDGLSDLMIWGFPYLHPTIDGLIKDEYRERLENEIDDEDDSEWTSSRQSEDKKKSKDDKKRKRKGR